MKIRKIVIELTLVSAVVLMTACKTGGTEGERIQVPSAQADLETYRDSEQSSGTAAEVKDTAETSDEIGTATLETIAALLGTSDSQAAEAFGGGEENWTEDKTFFIGRVYRVNLFGEEVPVYTSYDDGQLVNSVSIWLVNGERSVAEEEAVKWAERLNEFVGTKAASYEVSAETGSENWRWFSKDRSFRLNRMDDMLTISMNVMVGELN